MDITNPAEVAYIQHTYVISALVGTLKEFSGKTFEGIAFDNLDFQNAGSWTGQRCGHYDSSGHWIQQFNGTANDPAYRRAVIRWVQTMHAWLHTNYPTYPMAVNFSYDFSYPADSVTLLSSIDVDIDEQGFTHGNSPLPPGYYHDGQWYEKVRALQSFLAQKQKGWFSINQEPVSFAHVTTAQLQWALANYLLVKNDASYLYVTGQQEYGHLYIRPEYAAPIGSAVNSMYLSQNVYMRDFTNGKVMVSPSSRQTYTVALPANLFQSVYGIPVHTVTMAKQSGIVILKTVHAPASKPLSYPLALGATLGLEISLPFLLVWTYEPIPPGKREVR